MAVFGLGKKKVSSQQPVAGMPVEQVVSLRQQGYPNEQIIQILQSQGFNSSQIFDAMNQADIGTVPGNAQEYMQPDMSQTQQFQQQAQFQQTPSDTPSYDQSAYPIDDKEKMEEIAEAIIDEKWNELLKDFNKMAEINAKTDTRLTKMEQDIANLRDNFDTLHKGILGKISEYDQNLVNVGTEIKAMEKVFEKILPTFTDNVQRLSRIAEGKFSEPQKSREKDIDERLKDAEPRKRKDG